ncbi:hypothetical protein SEA_LOZINAK_80 [Gordonia phage Lozinak]|uniref:Uncharacterized protein n=5 Tax=Smoothievirus TaxID=1982557 RepID=A0A2D1GFZ8_9CAUD|nr:hypothetical protein BEN60_gp126 [Gordonia phage Smoothie]YP_009273114.1 hypothetical protein BH768_gp128 [Gordonia phage ClubL]YP_009276192.1 hypothetical protein BH772_gp130 [Gordonia phage Bachita]YP_009281235.1 hypothetical protein BIZ74_gp124 [Gordonia phage Cucurbita]ATN90706.1 hypothetical protein SEA_LOZINAK_80 [Gordonia phage Lozinak]AUE23587.1 hypothetical protein SEA_TONIANN_80 [Gordonia phage Toniann]QAU06944.1 hypothetical protein SEA_APHELION_79 [Gordonia phage Aphelion]QKY7
MPELRGVEQLAFLKLLEIHNPFEEFNLDMDSCGKCGCGKELHWTRWPEHILEEWLNL